MPEGGRSGRSRRRAPWSASSLGPVSLPDGELTLRSPVLADGPAWSAARLANRDWLERAFPAWGADWAAEQSEVAWAQRCWRLRLLSAAGRAKPFVMRLDGRLIGEIGLDAVDPVTGAGEASVWMVRSHGSPAVMNAASLLLIEHAFNGSRPVDRIVSPVATSSRAGRAPGLSAVGFTIEATVPRWVGAKGLVDHDIWVLHNTARNRRTAAAGLRAMAEGASSADRPSPGLGAVPTSPGSAANAATAGRAALREVRSAVRRGREVVAGQRAGRTTPARVVAVPGSDRAVSLRRATRRDLAVVGGLPTLPAGATRWAVEDDGVSAVIGHSTDGGTSTTQAVVSARAGSARDGWATALEAVLDDIRPAADEPRVLVVRVPRQAAIGTTPDPDLLSSLGLVRIASFSGNDEGTSGWGGEDLWRVPAPT